MPLVFGQKVTPHIHPSFHAITAHKLMWTNRQRCAHTHTHTHTHTYLHTHARTHARMETETETRTGENARKLACMHACMHMPHTHTHTRTHIHTHTHTHTHARKLCQAHQQVKRPKVIAHATRTHMHANYIMPTSK